MVAMVNRMGWELLKVSARAMRRQLSLMHSALCTTAGGLLGERLNSDFGGLGFP